MKVLLTGSSGQVGSALYPLLNKTWELLTPIRGASGSDELDLSDLDGLHAYLEQHRPGWIINTAAYTVVDQAETQPELARCINGLAPGLMADWCRRNGAFIVHLSTDYVFDGRAQRPYLEDDPTGPINVYGQSKLMGEEAITASGCQHLILRTSWVYSPVGKNFVKTILKLGSERSLLKVIDDQTGRPTAAANIAATLNKIFNKLTSRPQISGIFHYADSGATSWYDFALAILAEGRDQGLLESPVAVEPVSSQDFPQPAPRPTWSVLDTGKIQRNFGIEIQCGHAALKKCLSELSKKRNFRESLC